MVLGYALLAIDINAQGQRITMVADYDSRIRINAALANKAHKQIIDLGETYDRIHNIEMNSVHLKMRTLELKLLIALGDDEFKMPRAAAKEGQEYTL